MSGEDKLREYEKKLADTTRMQVSHVSGSGKVRVEGFGDVSISGSGSVSPDEINISGSGRIPGGLKTKRVICAGSVVVAGDIEAEEIRFSGSATVQGSITAKVLEASGTLAVAGGVKGSMVEVAGSFKAGRRVELDDTLRVHGYLMALEDVRVEKRVRLRGGFDVDGKVVAENLEAVLRRVESHVRNGIEAVNVDVRRRTERAFILFSFPALDRIFGQGRLYTTNISAKGKVFLENVTCDNVRGRVVILSEGCEVAGKVQYSESVSTHPSAKLVNAPEKVEVK